MKTVFALGLSLAGLLGGMAMPAYACPVDVEVDDDAEADAVAVSVFGDARGGLVSVSVAGDACGADIANVSVLGDAGICSQP